MTKYVVREDNDPGMPLGIGALSEHDTAEAAFEAIDAEKAAFAASPYGSSSGYLQRVVIEIDEDGDERRVDETSSAE